MPYTINRKTFNQLLQYVPHGINSEEFHPYDETDPKLIDFENKIFNGTKHKFIIFYNSRNVHRKRTSNIVMAYRQFCDNLPKEEAKKCALILHTEIMAEAGTNLLALKEALCPDYNIIFSPGKLTPADMCLMYNVADITINLSSNEGFGLSVAESIMCGTPVVVNVTGGMQDQIGQLDDNGKSVEFDGDFGSNSIGRYKTVGPWVYPIWPVTRVIQGSIPTPYIFDDLGKWEDCAEGFMYWYMMDKNKRVACGAEGRRWAMNEGGLNAKNMATQFIDGMEFVFANWAKPATFGIYTKDDYVGNKMPNGHMGFPVPTIDKEAIQKKLDALKI